MWVVDNSWLQDSSSLFSMDGLGVVSMVGVGDNRSRSTNLEKAKMEIEQNSKQMLASNRN